MIIDQPAWVPHTPCGDINFDQLEREYNWRRNPDYAGPFPEYAARTFFADFWDVR
jgi:hypothetical protein